MRNILCMKIAHIKYSPFLFDGPHRNVVFAAEIVKVIFMFCVCFVYCRKFGFAWTPHMPFQPTISISRLLFRTFSFCVYIFVFIYQFVKYVGLGIYMVIVSMRILRIVFSLFCVPAFFRPCFSSKSSFSRYSIKIWIKYHCVTNITGQSWCYTVNASLHFAI